MDKLLRAANFLLLVMLFIGINLVSSSGNRSSSKILCIESERDALLRFKKELEHPSNLLSSWDLEEDCCKWVGISCDNFTGHVKELKLPAENEASWSSRLKGKISDSILNLKYITHLDLSFNDYFRGIQIPSFLGSMESLHYLNLEGFHGSIPPQLGNLSNLNHLGLKGIPISYVEPLYSENLEWLHNFPSLWNLDLSYVDLSKASSWLLDINKLPSLRELHLSSCKLDHIVTLDHVNFTSLSILDISSNNFESFLPKWISNLSDSLVSLDLSYNNFQGPIPCALQNISTLIYLDLSSSGFNSSTIPSCLYTLHNLQHLSLRGLQLKGEISDDIGNLTNLVSIDLFMNELGGSIPSSIGNLCNLEHLSLSRNKFSEKLSEIFESFSGCLMDSLVSLDLSNNNISGHLTDQIAKLRNLSALSLDRNSISGPIPESIGNLSSLSELRIEDNKLNGTLPKSIGLLSSLQILSISQNRLEGIVSDVHFANLMSLMYLQMSENNLTLSFSSGWLPPFNLYYIYLRSCNLGPQFPKWLKSQKNFIDIDLSNAQISDTVPEWFWTLSNPHAPAIFNLSHNQLFGRIPDLLFNTSQFILMYLGSNNFHGNLPRISSNITELDLSDNSFSGNMSHFLCHSRNQNNRLEILHLGGNFLSGNIPDCWTEWMSLRVVKLGSNVLSGKLPNSMGSLSYLESLHLRNNTLSGKIPRSLKNCSNLRTLDLGLNAFQGNIPTWIGKNLSNLMVLGLRSNQFSGLIPDELCHLSSLQIMDISNNNLIGSIPNCFGNFTAMATEKSSSEHISYSFHGDEFLENAYVVTKGEEYQYNNILTLMTSMDLSDNNLSGEIPREIINLVGLRSLNLSGNHLEGSIPQQIGNMAVMESLDLSRNQLSGQIPPSMSKLTFLNSLNLSYNNLSGPIPTSTQLRGLNPSSFIGNELCGLPLTDSCQRKKTKPDRENGEAKEEGDENYIDEWFYLSVAIGSVVGFWGIWGPLLISKTWRYTYFRCLSSLWHKFN